MRTHWRSAVDGRRSAVGGQAGIEHIVRCLLAEMDLTMVNDGYPRIADLTRDAIRPGPSG